MRSLKYNIDLYSVCWNEMRILPFVIQYWKRFVRHAYVYDNGSDDGTVEYLKQFDWITVNNFVSDGFHEGMNVLIKNESWKGSDADYVIVCDIDECLYAKDMDKFFSWLNDNEISVYSPQWIECYSEDFPQLNDNKLCHELIGGGVYRKEDYLHKYVVINPKIVNDINYGPGCHFCKPIGEGIKMEMGSHAYLIHLKHVGFDYVCNRFEALKNRLSDYNKRMGFCHHYITCDKNVMRKEFDENKPLIKVVE